MTCWGKNKIYAGKSSSVGQEPWEKEPKGEGWMGQEIVELHRVIKFGLSQPRGLWVTDLKLFEVKRFKETGIKAKGADSMISQVDGIATTAGQVKKRKLAESVPLSSVKVTKRILILMSNVFAVWAWGTTM